VTLFFFSRCPQVTNLWRHGDQTNSFSSSSNSTPFILFFFTISYWKKKRSKKSICLNGHLNKYRTISSHRLNDGRNAPGFFCHAFTIPSLVQTVMHLSETERTRPSGRQTRIQTKEIKKWVGFRSSQRFSSAQPKYRFQLALTVAS
jgi:hypothetical protein